MNPSEWNTLIPVIVALVGPLAAKYGIADGTLSGWLQALGVFVPACYLMWSSWNMKRVKETAIVSGHTVDFATAQSLSVAPTEAGAGGKSIYTGPGAVK